MAPFPPFSLTGALKGHHLNTALLRDIAERALSTAVQAFLAVLIPALAAGVNDWSTAKKVGIAAGVAAIAAALSVVKGALAGQFGQSTSASALAADRGPIGPMRADT